MSDIQQAHYEERIRELQGLVEKLRDRISEMQADEGSWHNAAMAVGERLAPIGPDWYYHMKPDAWRIWALDAINVSRTDWREKQPK